MFDPTEWQHTLKAARNGDTCAADHLAQMVLAFSRKTLQRWNEKDLDGDEIIAEVAARVCEEDFLCLVSVDSARIEAYVATSLWHERNDQLRTQHRHHELEDQSFQAAARTGESRSLEEFATGGQNPAEIAMRRLLMRDIRAAVGEMSDKNQKIFELFFVQEWSAREIGARLGMKTGTVEWHIHSVRKQLIERLGDAPSQVIRAGYRDTLRFPSSGDKDAGTDRTRHQARRKKN